MAEPTSKGTQKKIDIVATLTEKLQKAKSVVLADYRGLKHQQMEELRTSLKDAKAELIVAKNRLFKRALGEQSTALDEHLKDPTAILFSYEDEISPVKTLLSYFKHAGTGRAKAGILAGKSLSEADVTALSKLPDQQTLRARLVGQLNAPIQGLHFALSWNLTQVVYALNAIKESKNK